MQVAEGLLCLTLTVACATWMDSTRQMQPGFAGEEQAHTLMVAGLCSYCVAAAVLLVRVCCTGRIPRWQMAPALLALPGLAPLNAPLMRCVAASHELLRIHGRDACMPEEVDTSWRTCLATAVLLSLVGLSALLCNLLPMAEFRRIPAAWWKFRYIGLAAVELELAARDDKLHGRSSRYPVKVYYPAAHGGASPYASRLVSRAISKAAGLGGVPSFAFSHLGQLQIELVHGAPLHEQAKELPLMVFSHGLSALPCVYWSLICNFVQAGHIVVCPEHNDGTAATVVLEDGSEHEFEPLAGKFSQTADAQQRTAQERAWRHAQLRRRVAEATVAADWMLGCSSDSASRWAGSVDASRIVYAGHSFGGATALVAADADPKATACVAYDGRIDFVSPEVLDEGLRRCPTLLVQGEVWADRANADETIRQRLLTPWEGKGHPANELWVAPKAGHQNFTDVALHAPLIVKLMRLAGWVDADKCRREVIRRTLECVARLARRANLG